MAFDPALYGENVARILSIDGNGSRMMPLVARGASSSEAHRILKASAANVLFPESAAPSAAMAGLWLYFSSFDEAHAVAQDDPSQEGSYWHAIVHRQEPDAGNAAYWFRQVGTHPIFPALARAAGRSGRWDPFAFLEMCEQARRHPGSEQETRARVIQRAEWQLLFDYCARPAAA